MEEIIRSFEVDDMQVLKGERAILARINTAAVDRLRTVIDPFGGDYSHFNKTRSVMWQHGLDQLRGTLPIGSGWVKTRRAENDMIGKTAFRKDDFSQAIFEAYEDESIRGWSIKAGVRESSPPTKAEIRSRPELEACDLIYRKWDLIEYSATPTPGNSDCLTLMVQRGLITAPEGFVLPEPVVVPETPEVPAHTERYIDSDGSVWRIFEPDGTPVIAFDDPEIADECLRIMSMPPQTINHEVSILFGEMRAIEEQHRSEIKEFIDLYRWGRI